MQTPAETLKKRFPNASESFLRLNSGVSLPSAPPDPRFRGEVTPDEPTEPSPGTPLKSQGNGVSMTGDGRWAFTLPYPPSVNRVWRSIVIKGSVRVLLSSEGRAYKKAVAELAGSMMRLVGPVGMLLRVYRPRRVGDLGNRIKVIEDALQGVAYVNDSQIERLEATRHDDKANPRVEVEVWSLPHARQGDLPL